MPSAWLHNERRIAFTRNFAGVCAEFYSSGQALYTMRLTVPNFGKSHRAQVRVFRKK